MKAYTYLLFDLDGTLVYSHEGIYYCLRHTLQALKRQPPQQEQMQKFIGPPLETGFASLFGMTPRQTAEAVRIYREEYARTGQRLCRLIDGAKEGLLALKTAGFTLGMSTSKAHVFAEQIAKRLDFFSCFSTVVGCGEDGSLNTKAEVMEETLRRLGADKRQTLMIGDRRQDVEGAKTVGVDCAVLQCGYGEAGEFENPKPKYVFADFAALTAALLKSKDA